MVSQMGMCMVDLYSELMALERLLACSRTNVCLNGGECNNLTSYFEYSHLFW